MLDIYKTINDRQIILGQTSSGIWYCKELPCTCIHKANKKIGEINKILNKYNQCSKKEKKAPAPPKKEKNKGVRM